MPQPGQDWGAIIDDEAAKQGIRPALARAVAQTESNFDPNAVSPKGAVGVMQLMPDTAKMLGVDINNPEQNIRGGVRYLAQLHKQFNGDTAKALAAYNAGPGKVDHPPEETKQYIQKVTQNAAQPGNDASHLFVAPMAQSPGMPKPGADASHLFGVQTAQGVPNPPSLADQGQFLAQGGLMRAPQTMVGAMLSPSNIGSTVGGIGGEMLGATLAPETGGLSLALPWVGRMLGTGLGSAAGQKIESGDVSPWQTGLDAATAGIAPLIEGGVARIASRNTLPKAITQSERDLETLARGESDTAAFKQGRAADIGNRLMDRGSLPASATIGRNTQQGILATDAAARQAAVGKFQQVLEKYGENKVGTPPRVLPGEDVADKRLTFSQMHSRQSTIGDDAAAAWKSGDYKTARTLWGRQENLLNKMQGHIAGVGGDPQEFMDARQMWSDISAKERNSAVQKLMGQAHDVVDEAMLDPKTLAGKAKSGGAFKGGTQSPNEIVEALKSAMPPAQFEQWKQGAHAKLIDSSVKDGEVKFGLLSQKMKKMGGNFTALFDPAERQELQDAVESMKQLTQEAAKHKATANSALETMKTAKDQMSAYIPPMPSTAKSVLKYGLLGATGGGALSYASADPNMISASTKAAALLGLASVLKDSPAIVKGLLASPVGRQALSAAAKNGWKASPMVDRVASMVLQIGGTTANRYLQDVPNPPTSSTPR